MNRLRVRVQHQLLRPRGYVGEWPCGDSCDVSLLGPEVEAAMGAVATPDQGPGAAPPLPDLPGAVPHATIEDALALRLPK